MEALKFLLKLGGDIDELTERGELPLHAATLNGNAVVKFLVVEGVDTRKVSKEGYTVLHSAAEEGGVDVAEFLLKHGCDMKE